MGENPLVPAGCLLTCGFLINGLFKFGRRDSAASQQMMRGRIAAQVLWSVQCFVVISVLVRPSPSSP